MKTGPFLSGIAALLLASVLTTPAAETIFEEDFETFAEEQPLPLGPDFGQWRADGYGSDHTPGVAEILRDPRLNDTLVLHTSPKSSNPSTLFNIVREFTPINEDASFSVDVTPLVGTAQISLFSMEREVPSHFCMVHLRVGREMKAFALERDEAGVTPVEIAPIRPGTKYRVEIRLSFQQSPPEWSVRLINLDEEREVGFVEGLKIKLPSEHISHLLLGTTHSSDGEALWDNIRLQRE